MRDGAGFLIALEGSDSDVTGALSSALADRLSDLGHVVARASDSNGCTIGGPIADLVAAPGSDLDAISASLLLTAARRQLLTTIIQPALRRGEIVVCNGFVNSMLARWSSPYGLSADVALMLHSIGCDDLWPDLTILIETSYAPSPLLPHATDRHGAGLDRLGASLRKSMAYIPDGDYGVVDASGPADALLARTLRLVEANDGFERFVRHPSVQRQPRAA